MNSRITSDGGGCHLLVLEVGPAQVPVLMMTVPMPAQVFRAVGAAQTPRVREGAHERRQRMR